MNGYRIPKKVLNMKLKVPSRRKRSRWVELIRKICHTKEHGKKLRMKIKWVS
jgi:hypothetical protein